MTNALIALHFQNDICHPDGRIPYSLNRNTPEAEAFLAAARNALATTRAKGWAVAHVHIAFKEDYSDLPRPARLFQKAAKLGAVKRGSWGAAPYAGFEPRAGEITVTRPCNSGFRYTDLDALLRARDVDSVWIMGMATQFSVDHTARDAADLSYRVSVLADCCASADAEAHRCSLRTLGMLADIVDVASLGTAVA